LLKVEQITLIITSPGFRFAQSGLLATCWEYLIRDEEDFRRHVEYCYIKSSQTRLGDMTRVRDWPHSSFHRDVRMQLFPEDWAAILQPKVASASGADDGAMRCAYCALRCLLRCLRLQLSLP
jgi:hypothetical protein